MDKIKLLKFVTNKISFNLEKDNMVAEYTKKVKALNYDNIDG